MILLPHVAARLFNTELAIDPRKLSAIALGLGARVVDGGFEIVGGASAIEHVAFSQGRPSESMGRLGDPLGSEIERAGYGERMLYKVGNVAVIPVEGTLVHKGKHLGQSSGQTSYEGVQARVARAMRDDAVRGVVFEMDSYGGEVHGAFETARMISELSARKPTLAILTENALSAGYLLASAARRIVVPETGHAGSIGVVTMHADFSQQLESSGVKVTLIASGAHKTDAHPALPLSDEVRGAMQARVDSGRALFASTVAEFRGPRLSRAAALATEAQVYRGEDAARVGLVDGVIDPIKAFQSFVSLT
jgi:signal peptide peptidase SppA